MRDFAPRRSRINFIRYADDFVITGKSRQLLENTVLPIVKQFLEKRGLSLSKEKTKITYIYDGFTFLGQTFRKHGSVMHITPSKEAIATVTRKAGDLIRKYVSAPMEVLIGKLNSTLRGWGNYHRHVVSFDVFKRVDTYVYDQLWRMLHRRHSNKSKGWLIHKYWKATDRWIFSITKRWNGKSRLYQVLRLCDIGIKRHIKIKANANPYLPEFSFYFYKRRNQKGAKLMRELSARLMRRRAIV